jgi:hypothetical protein
MKVGFMAMNLKCTNTLFKETEASESNVKSMLIRDFDTDRIILKEFISPGQTINKT